MFNIKVKYVTLFTVLCLTACNPDITIDAETPTQQTRVQEKVFDAQTGEPNAYEMARTEVVPILDTSTDRQYELYVKLPEGYKTYNRMCTLEKSLAKTTHQRVKIRFKPLPSF